MGAPSAMTEAPSGRRRFKPGLWATVCTAATLVILIALGTWQVQRLYWKQGQIAERQSRSTVPAVSLPREIDDPAGLEFHRVALTGHFLHDRELYLSGRTVKRQVGFHVVTPMVLTDGRGVLVDRGWVPDRHKDPSTRAKGQIAGQVTLEALVRQGGWKAAALFRPDNQPGDNLWLWVDPPAMAARAGLGNPVTAIYLEAGPAANPGGLPIGGQTRLELRNDHLQYAITWYALAVALVVIYVLFQLRREGEA